MAVSNQTLHVVTTSTKGNTGEVIQTTNEKDKSKKSKNKRARAMVA
jgi:hypothetical protein